MVRTPTQGTLADLSPSIPHWLNVEPAHIPNTGPWSWLRKEHNNAHTHSGHMYVYLCQSVQWPSQGLNQDPHLKLTIPEFALPVERAHRVLLQNTKGEQSNHSCLGQRCAGVCWLCSAQDDEKILFPREE